MSDLGLLSYEYQMLLDLTQHLKEWVGQLKRLHFDLAVLEGPDHVSPGEAATSLELVVRFLCDVIGQEPSEWPEKWISALPLPVDIVDRLRELHSLDLPQYRQHLNTLAEHLDAGADSITDKDIVILDEIVAAAGADTNAVFRRLMRWR